MGDSQYGVIVASALLYWDSGSNTFGAQEVMRIVSVAGQLVEPGVRGWLVTVDPTINLSPSVGVVQFISNDRTFSGIDARLLVTFAGDPNKVLVFLVDALGAPVDVATVAALGPPGGFFGAQLHGVRAGGGLLP
jgi:hypothetical protein